MKQILKFLPLLLLTVALTSCSSVRVAADYDKETSFDDYKTFAFFKGEEYHIVQNGYMPFINKADFGLWQSKRCCKSHIQSQKYAPYFSTIGIVFKRAS